MPITTPDMPSHEVGSSLEVKQTQKNGFEKGLEDINAKLALQGLKLEMPKTKEQEEQEVLELVKQRGLKKSFDNNRFPGGAEVAKVKENVFVLIAKSTGNVNYFIDRNGNIILGILSIKKRYFVEKGKSYEEAGYIEKKENGVFNMYKVEGEKHIGPIDIRSPEYYQARLDIVFYDDVIVKLYELEHTIKNSKKGIWAYIYGHSFKIEDLELFKKKGMIDEEIFEYGLGEIRKILVEQCGDRRLIGLGVGIKESDVKKYLEKGYIDKELALQCFSKLPSEMRNISNKKPTK